MKRSRLHNLVEHNDEDFFKYSSSKTSNYRSAEGNKLDYRNVNYSLDISNNETSSEEECNCTDNDEDNDSCSDSSDDTEEEEQDEEYDIPLALRFEIHHAEEEEESPLKRTKLNNSTLNISIDNSNNNESFNYSDDQLCESDNESIVNLEEFQYSYFKKTGIYLKETRPRLYAIKLGSIIVMEKLNGKLYNCGESFMVAKIGSTELLNDKRIDKLIGGLETLGLGPELIDTKIIFPKGLSLTKWETDWRRELALYTFSKEDMLDLGVNDHLGPSEYILTYGDINTDLNIQKPKRELHLFLANKDGKTLWKTTRNNSRHHGKLLEPVRPCSQCDELVSNSQLATCHSCNQTHCDKCHLRCNCCHNYFCMNSACYTKCDICDTLYCTNCVPKCEVCHEFCCSYSCATILPCECGVICTDCNVKKQRYCHECQMPICSKCGVKCGGNGCSLVGCKDCIPKCVECLERFCPDCGMTTCHICGREVCKHNCSDMISECRSCGNNTCHDCTSNYNNKKRSNKLERTCSECKS